MTQTLIDTLAALALIALYWGGPLVLAALAFALRKRAQRRYHVGNPQVAAPVQTFRSRQAAVEASLDFYAEHGRCGKITATR